ncbi:MAG: glycoside hydrolase family 127 protein [Muribaculaceae bacterium]|nr:glycoside hydrolase family 127 protein [Muribaculaceae bacterium]
MNIRHLLTVIISVVACGAAAQSVYPGQHAGKMAVGTGVPVKAQSFDLKDVRLLPGRVRDNLARDSAWMASIQVNRLLHSFRTNAGVFAGLEGGYESVPKLGGWESLDCDLRGHTTGHLLSAYGLMYAATGDPLFKLKGDSLVSGLAEVQAALGPTGYLSAFPEELINRNMRGKSVWAPWYTLHKLLAGLIDQYLYADNAQALDVARKMGDWAHGKLNGLPDETRRLMLRNEFGGINEAFYNLYAITGDTRYRDLAAFFYHNDVIAPLRDGDTDFGTKHTNTFIPKVIGEARNYELGGSADSRAISDLFWHEMTDHHSFVTGSSSQKEHYFDPARMADFINGYTGETCCTYNMLKLSRHLFCWDASPVVADYYERALFNHILAQQDTATGMVCYFLPLLNGAYKVYSTPEQSFWCCVGSGFESHAKYAEAIYYHGGTDTLMVNLFIPSRLTWRDRGLTVTQTTGFPADGRVTLTVDTAPDAPMTIALRYPSWSGQPTVRINGRRQSTGRATPSSYITLKRHWKAGDTITVDYPMSLRLETVAGDTDRGALLYGPIVLAGNLGTEGMQSPAPFSDPTVRNDYYTYDYRLPATLPDTISIDRANPGRSITPTAEPLHFRAPNGVELLPLYDAHHHRYVVYWHLK